METYRIENLTFVYPKRDKPALTDISFKIEQGAFVVLCGPSGCGKTTLLRQLKPTAAPHGVKSGVIYFNDTPLEDMSLRDGAAKIGFVMQSPENQIVTDKVWHELAFGLESLGFATAEIRLRVAEMASFLGIQNWFHKPVVELSGGQKQMLALGSIMALQPSVLILDEPTSQLDPIAAGDFLAAVGKINRELGVTVVLTEHRLEEAFPLATHAVALEAGQVVTIGTPGEVGLDLWRQRTKSHGMFLAMPTPMRVWAACNKNADDNCPITVREGATWLRKQSESLDQEEIKNLILTSAQYHDDETESDSNIDNRTPLKKHPLGKVRIDQNLAINLEDIWFRYDKNLPDILKGVSFKGYYGEIAAILGGNGTGKTTAFSIVLGLNKPYRGKVYTSQRAYALPQNPQSLFTAKTVREDLLEVLSPEIIQMRLSKEQKNQKLSHIVKLCRLEGLLESHPYDLSGGEQQRAALAKVLLLQPKILLLDEPTKGLDAEYKQIFAGILRKLKLSGAAIIIVSHDVEFCAQYADRCALFFDGAIVSENTPRAFFSGNSFYTTSANRMARSIIPGVVTASDIIVALDGELPPEPEEITLESKPQTPLTEPQEDNPKLSATRKWVLSAFIIWLLAVFVFAWPNFDNLTGFIGGGSEALDVASEGVGLYVGIILAFVFGVIGITLTLSWNRKKSVHSLFLGQGESTHSVALKQGESAQEQQTRKLRNRKLPMRTIVAAVMVLLAIPVTIYVGVFLFDDRRFYFISLLIILQTMLPFALVFEGRKPQARELVIIAVLCAIGVAGRGAFFMLPQFKPVIAIVIISGVAFGGETGFLVGAMTGLVSNMFFGQGPWTPWQMFAFGIIGFLGGVLFHKGLISRSPVPLAIFGGFATFIVYGGIMNPAAVLMFQSNPMPEMFLLAYLQGIPFDIIHAAATVTFLLIISRPMLVKLDRIKIKYGLVE